MRKIKFLIGFLSLIAMTCLLTTFVSNNNKVYADEYPSAINTVSKSTVVAGESFDLICTFDTSCVPTDYVYLAVETTYTVYDPNEDLIIPSVDTWIFPEGLSNYDMSVCFINKAVDTDYRRIRMGIAWPDDGVEKTVADVGSFSITIPGITISETTTQSSFEFNVEQCLLSYLEYEYDPGWDELVINESVTVEVEGLSTVSTLDTLNVTSNKGDSWSSNETDSNSNNDFISVFEPGLSVSADTTTLTLSGTGQDGATIQSVTPGTLSGSSYSIPLNGPGEDTTVSVVVASKAGNTTTYDFVVSRDEYAIADLSGITFTNPSGVSGDAPKLSPSFSASTTSYTLDIPDKVSGVEQKLIIKPSVNSTYKIQGITLNGNAITTGSDNLVSIDGVNSLAFVVTAQDGTTKTYNFTINRLSNDNSLNGDPTITILNSNGNVDLTSSDWTLSGTTYAASVDYTGVTGFKINASATDSNATITYNPSSKEVSFGTGYTQVVKSITFTITSESGIDKTYTVTITREVADSNVEFVYEVTGASSGTQYTANKTGTQWVFTLPADEGSAKINFQATSSTTVLSGSAASNNLAFTDTYYTLTVTPEYASKAVTYQIFIKKSGSSGSGDGESSTSAYLVSLSVGSNNYSSDSGDIPQKITIRVDHNVETIDIVAIACADATISGLTNSTNSLSVGQNKISLTVTAANPDYYKNYTIIVYRADDDAVLTGITISNTDYVFNASETNKTITVPYNITNVEVNVSSSSAYATGKGSTTYQLQNVTPTNPLTITVQVCSEYYGYNSSEGSKSQAYVFTIIREARNTNTYLSSLSVSVGGQEVAFDSAFTKDDDTYIIENIGDGVTSINVQATPEASTSTVSGTGTIELPGTMETAFLTTVKVTAQSVSGDTEVSKTYKIYISRGSVDLSTKNEITSITVTGSDGNIYFSSEFNQSVYTYSIQIPVGLSSVSVNATFVGASLSGAKTYMAVKGGTFEIVVFATSEAGVEGNKYTISVYQPYGNTDSTLKYIQINGELIAGFDPNKFDYNASYPFATEMIDVFIDTTDPTAIARITINNQGHDGLNIPLLADSQTVITITVYPESGDDNSTYTLIVSRAPADGILATLYIEETNFHDENGNLITYSRDINTYYATVSYAQSSITICASPLDNSVYIRGAGVKPLNVGMQRFQVTAIPENPAGNVSIYYVYVIRKAEPTNTTDISKFTITEIPNFVLEFRNDCNVYESLTVPSYIKQLDIDIEFQVGEFEDLPTYQISNNNLLFGINSVIVVVTSPDLSTTRTIILQVKRSDVEVNSAHIEQIEAFNLDFNSEVTNYNYRVKSDIEHLDIMLSLADNEANTYEISDTNLKNGNNTITITLKAGEEVNKVIYLTVYKEASISALDITLAIGAIVVLSGCFVILRKKKKTI